MSEIIRKDIAGYEGLYQVSNTGLVMDLKKNKLVNIYRNKIRYSVRLFDGEKYLVTTLCRLVAMAFVPNPKGLPLVEFKDLNVKNSNCNNLYWSGHRRFGRVPKYKG